MRAAQLRRVALCGALATMVALGGCATVMPAIKALVVAFGQDMLAAASVNYAPRYAHQLETLLAVLAREATGMNFQPQLQQVGYQAPPPKYMQPKPQAAGTGYDQPDQPDEVAYAGSANAEADYAEADYGGSAYAEADSGFNDTYAAEDEQYNQDSPSTDGFDDLANAKDPYQSSAEGEFAMLPTDNPYQIDQLDTNGGVQARSAKPERIALGVALLVQKAGTTQLVELADGDVVRDGRGNPANGDLLKVHFRSNCNCYVYIIGVDATGYVAQIFPDVSSGGTNPVAAGMDYLMPGNNQWWALDDRRGVETLYFVASETPRGDLEAAINSLTSQAQELARPAYQAVARPAIIPPTRGMVKISVPPVSLNTGAHAAQIQPDAFVATLQGVGVTATRWFRHQ